MSISALIRSMAAAGATPEAIALAVEAIEAAQARADDAMAAVEARKNDARERKRRERARKSEISSDVTDGHATCHAMSRDTSRDVTDDALSLPLLPPQTPLTTPTHTRGITSRPRKGARFAEFWEIYPRKVGKKAALKAYDGALADIDGDDPEEAIIAGLRRALPGWSSGKFIPNPATWLNQGRWDDQPAGTAPYRAQTPLEALAATPDPLDVWRRRVNAFRNGSGFWNTTDWEAQPGRPGCIVPSAILLEFDIQPATPQGAAAA